MLPYSGGEVSQPLLEVVSETEGDRLRSILWKYWQKKADLDFLGDLLGGLELAGLRRISTSS